MAINDKLQDFLDEWHGKGSTIIVHTSGSTGQPKPIEVEKARMRASARMTCDFLGIKDGETALLCMPLDFIAGKMMVVRAMERHLRLVLAEPSGHPLKSMPQTPEGQVVERIGFAAMVPLQVYNSLQIPEERERLMRIDNLIIGGGAIDKRLEDELRTLPNAIWSTYGMTETLSHIALRRVSGPDASLWYKPFEGISLRTTTENALVIDAPELCGNTLVTHDIVEIRDDGCFRIIGRTDNIICSGGIKIQIEKVEEALARHFGDTIQVTSAADEKYGEQVVYLTTRPLTMQELSRLDVLVANPFWKPRRIMRVAKLPKTGTGKPDRARAKRIANLPILYYKVRARQDMKPEELEDLIETLPSWRREVALKYKHTGGRAQSALAFDLLRGLLRTRFCMDDAIEPFAIGPHGKPYLPSHPWIHFNMSHCDLAVAVAVSENEVGIDVEKIRPFRESLGRHVLNEEEYDHVHAASTQPSCTTSEEPFSTPSSTPSSDRAFIRIWTQKEAVLKLTGEGVNSHMHNVLHEAKLSNIVLQTEEYDTHIVSLATRG